MLHGFTWIASSIALSVIGSIMARHPAIDGIDDLGEPGAAKDCGHSGECECEREGDDIMPNQYQRIDARRIDQTQLLNLLESIEKKCAEIRQKYLDSPANRGIEMFRQTYELKERLREADAYAREAIDPLGDVRPYRNLAIREFQKNYPARQHERSADAAIEYFNKRYRR
jgi:hypothetical protein